MSPDKIGALKKSRKSNRNPSPPTKTRRQLIYALIAAMAYLGTELISRCVDWWDVGQMMGTAPNTKQQRIKDEANRKRAEAAKGQEVRGNRHVAPKKLEVEPQSEARPLKQPNPVVPQSEARLFSCTTPP